MAEDGGFAMGYALGADGNNGGGGMFNGDGFWGIILLALLFGNRGFGGGFGGNGGGDNVSAGFAWQGIDNGIRGIQQGICDSTYALNNTITNGFHGVDRGLCDISHQISDCCCSTQQAIANSTREILGYLTNEKIESLRDENLALRFQASQAHQNAFITANQDAQTAELIRRLGKDNPVPAYLVQPSTPLSFPTNGCGTVQFGGYGNGYGGCGSYGGCGCGF